MILTRYPRRAYLRSFWISLCLVLGLAGGTIFVGLTAAAIDTMVWLVVGVLVVALLGYGYPHIVRKPYAVMYRCFEYYGKLLRICLKLACFFLVFVVVGRAGSKLPVGPRPEHSMWLPRKSTPNDEFGDEFEGKRGMVHQQWVATYLAWAHQSGNGWAVMLLPFLVLLAAFEPEEERSFPATIYTLF